MDVRREDVKPVLHTEHLPELWRVKVLPRGLNHKLAVLALDDVAPASRLNAHVPLPEHCGLHLVKVVCQSGKRLVQPVMVAGWSGGGHDYKMEGA